jgi:hypothetical protein
MANQSQQPIDHDGKIDTNNFINELLARLIHVEIEIALLKKLLAEHGIDYEASVTRDQFLHQARLSFEELALQDSELSKVAKVILAGRSDNFLKGTSTGD